MTLFPTDELPHLATPHPAHPFRVLPVQGPGGTAGAPGPPRNPAACGCGRGPEIAAAFWAPGAPAGGGAGPLAGSHHPAPGAPTTQGVGAGALAGETPGPIHQARPWLIGAGTRKLGRQVHRWG